MSYLSKLAIKFDSEISGRLLLMSVIVGACAGVVAAMLYGGVTSLASGVMTLYESLGIFFPEVGVEQVVIEQGFADQKNLATTRLFDFLIVPKYWFVLLLMPMLGGLACGLLVYSFAPETFGEGTDTFIKSYHRRGALVRLRILLTKWMATVVTLGSGGSGGWEGTMTLLGGGIGSRVARWSGSTVPERRMLYLAGAAGGLGAILQAPFGGALLAIELLYCTLALEFRAFLPCVIASITGSAIFHFLAGPIWFSIPIAPEKNLLVLFAQLPAWIFCALTCAVVGACFVWSLHSVRNQIFRRLALPHFLKPAIGGIGLGCVAIVFPQVMGTGQNWIGATMHAQLPLALMAALIIPKIVATVFTVASGGSGGLLMPSFFIGGLVGGVCGGIWQKVCLLLGIPELAPSLTIFVLLGMGGFYAGVGKVPLAAAVIVCEISGNAWLVAPILLVGLIHLAIQSPRVSLYEDQVLTPLDSPAHFGVYVTDILEAIRVKEVMPAHRNIVTISEHDSMREVMQKSLGAEDSLLPVLDSRGDLVGLIGQADVRASFASLGTQHLLAADLVQLPHAKLHADDTLYAAMRMMRRYQITEIPVVDAHNPRALLGVLRDRDIIAAHHRALVGARVNS